MSLEPMSLEPMYLFYDGYIGFFYSKSIGGGIENKLTSLFHNMQDQFSKGGIRFGVNTEKDRFKT